MKAKHRETSGEPESQSEKLPDFELLPIESLKPNPRNARTHPKRQIDAIAAAIRRWGFTNPILVDADGLVVAGHGRLQAARQLGMSSVPCLRLAKMTPEELRAYALADNRLGELSEWDSATLLEELDALKTSLPDFAGIGFLDEELSRLMPEEVKNGVKGGKGGRSSEDKLANTAVTVGPYRFTIQRADWEQWNEKLRQSAGFETKQIEDEIRRRLQL